MSGLLRAPRNNVGRVGVEMSNTLRSSRLKVAVFL